MTLSPEIHARLKPVILGVLNDLKDIAINSDNDKDVLTAIQKKLHANLVASELTREDLATLAMPSITSAFVNTLYEANKVFGDKPNAN